MNGITAGSSIGTMIMPGIGTAVGAGVGALVGGLKSLFGKMFGGPSKKELECRSARDQVGQALTQDLSEGNRIEMAAGIEGWMASGKGATAQGLAEAVVLKNAFRAAGLGDTMGLDYAQKLAGATKSGPESVKKVVEEIKLLLGKFTPKGLLALGFGGIVNKPTPALIGERGPEAVIPLTKLESMMGSMNKKDTSFRDMVQALKTSGISGGAAIHFNPIFQGTLEHEMKGLIRTKLWPMFLDVLRESGQLRREASVVINDNG
jgi:hypothetical protein